MADNNLLLAICDAMVLDHQGRRRTDADHRRFYNLMAAAERHLPTGHPALEEIRRYQDEIIHAIETRDHRRLVLTEQPYLLAAERNQNPQEPWPWRDALRRAAALESATPIN